MGGALLGLLAAVAEEELGCSLLVACAERFQYSKEPAIQSSNHR